MCDKIVFYANGQKQEISADVDYRSSLDSFLRRRLNLTGTKVMCNEGGCGVCIVNIKGTHPVTGDEYTYAINSCLVSPFSCQGKEITTIEGLGDKQQGYNPLQRRLANFNGSQCGFCSPGWVLNMYSALKSNNNKLTMGEIESYFDGNLCRCTGYRPILDAMKSFATDVSYNLRCQLSDIEDMHNLKKCFKEANLCVNNRNLCEQNDLADYCVIDGQNIPSEMDKRIIEIDFKDHTFIKVFTLGDLFKILSNYNNKTCRLINGNTGKGVYSITSITDIEIDISDVTELRTHTVGTNLELGSGITLTEVIKIFENISSVNGYFEYLKELENHLKSVANIPVRNIGTIAGNLSLKHDHKEFSSDIFLLLETIGAVITIGNKTSILTMDLQTYLKTDMKGKVILKLDLPPMNNIYILKTYKITPRSQNAHALVNAGFCIKTTSESSTIVKSASIVYGNISPDFVHAKNTEKYLVGKNLYDSAVLANTLNELKKEINPVNIPAETSPEFRKQLALSLWYKFVLHTIPQRLLNPKYKSGANLIERPLSSGKQVYDKDPSNYPPDKFVIKLEAQIQCSGEAKYTDDMPSMPNQLYASIILATIPRGILINIDASEAMKMNGVVAVYTAEDIPGNNYFNPPRLLDTTATEEIFVPYGGLVKYNGQPIGVIVANKEEILDEAVKLVKVAYKDVASKAIVNISDALTAPLSENRVLNDKIVQATSRGENVDKIIDGVLSVQSQYHFHMENQCCVCIPTDDGMDIFVPTHWTDQVNSGVAGMLKLKENIINVYCRRLGGSFGGKLSRASLIACICALPSYKLNRPVRLVLPLVTNMRAIGKKQACLANYEVAIDSNGKIQYLNNTFYLDNGWSPNEPMSVLYTLPAFTGTYDNSTWNISVNTVFTDKASNTFLRAPGSCDGIAMAENIMDHIAFTTGLDPIKVRLTNMSENNELLGDMMNHLIVVADYYNRLENVNNFNSTNRWKKKGINLSVMSYPYGYEGSYYAIVSIYHIDGTVSVTLAGTEMGQGINTKIAQVVSIALGIPLAMVAIKQPNSISTPNSNNIGGSTGSDVLGYAAKKACDILNTRLSSIKKDNPNLEWIDIIELAFQRGVNMSATYMYAYGVDPLEAYPINGVCISEVEVDILIGNHMVTRVDILEDVGDSLSPLIDVGQVEGAFIMALGFWTVENLLYDSNTGQLLTDRTWTYNVNGAKDIPVDFRVYFRRNAYNPLGILGSKATSEPPMTLAFSVAQAIRHALASARVDAGFDKTEWFNLKYPLTTENILLAAGTNIQQFKIC